jgi:hypothetical protein
VLQECCGAPDLSEVVLLLEAALRHTAHDNNISPGAASCLFRVGRFGLNAWELKAALRVTNSTIRSKFIGMAVRDAWPAIYMKAFLQQTAEAVAQQQEGDNAHDALLTALAQLQLQQTESGQREVQSVLQNQGWAPPALPASSEAMFSLCCSFLKCLDATATVVEQLAVPPAAARAAVNKQLDVSASMVGSAEDTIVSEGHQQPCFACLLPQLTALIGTALSDGYGSCLDAAATSSQGCSSSSSSEKVGIELLAKCLKWQLLSARACYTAGAWLQQHDSRMQDRSSQQEQQQQGQAWLSESEVLSSSSCLAAWTCMAVQQLTQLQAQVVAAAADADSAQAAAAAAAGMLPQCVAGALRLLPLQFSTSRGEPKLEELCQATLAAVRQADEDAGTCMATQLHAWYSEKQQLTAQFKEVTSKVPGWNKLANQWDAATCNGSRIAPKHVLVCTPAVVDLLPKIAALLPEFAASRQALLENLQQAQKMLQQPLPGELYRCGVHKQQCSLTELSSVAQAQPCWCWAVVAAIFCCWQQRHTRRKHTCGYCLGSVQAAGYIEAMHCRKNSVFDALVHPFTVSSSFPLQYIVWLYAAGPCMLCCDSCIVQLVCLHLSKGVSSWLMMGGAACRDVFDHTRDVQHLLTQLQELKAWAANLRNCYNSLQKRSGRSSKPAGRIGVSGKGAGTQQRLQQRLQAKQAAGSSLSAGAATAAGTALAAAASVTVLPAALGTATAAATAGNGQDGWVSKQGGQPAEAADDGGSVEMPAPPQAAAVSGASSARATELRRCGELLQALGSRVWSLLPQRYACNNLACANLAGVSEGLLVAGRGCVCARCRVARWAKSRAEHRLVQY